MARMIETHDIRWFAADGALLPSRDGAERAVVTEYLDGVEVQRTYAGLTGEPSEATPADPVALLPINEDQAKSTWDLTDTDADGKLIFIETRPQLFHFLGIDAVERPLAVATICKFMELPVWDAAPPTLAGEVYGWLRDGGETKSLEAGLEVKRDTLREDAERKLVRWEEALEDLLTKFYERQREVLLAKMQGPKLRRGTRHWRA